jgi:NADH-quinone oxidoreductase subunit H
VLFLGGWQGPGAQDFPTLGAVYFVAKSFAAYFLLVWARATLPRMRIDRMLDFCWKVLTPAMIVLIGAIAVTDRALADSPFWLRQGALLGVNVIVAAAAIALLGRRPHTHPLAPSPSAGVPRERGKGSGAGGEAGETAA